jgi:hypothetical protein
MERTEFFLRRVPHRNIIPGRRDLSGLNVFPESIEGKSRSFV